MKTARKSPAPVDRWKAVRNGVYFCSPACGCRCTWAAYRKAVADAAALCQLLGPGWSSHVWEGWHHKAVCGPAQDTHNLGLLEMYGPSQCEDKHYILFLQTDPQIILSGSDPVKLLKEMRVAAQARIVEMECVIEHLATSLRLKEPL